MKSLALLLTLLTACGGEEPQANSWNPETPEYRAWYTDRAKIMTIPIMGNTEKLEGRITILPPERRSENPADFCRVFFNRKLAFTCSRQSDGSWSEGEFKITLIKGPTNWIALWDSSSNTALNEQVDTRYGTEFIFRPVEGGYEMEQIQTE